MTTLQALLLGFFALTVVWAIPALFIIQRLRDDRSRPIRLNDHES